MPKLSHLHSYSVYRVIVLTITNEMTVDEISTIGAD